MTFSFGKWESVIWLVGGLALGYILFTMLSRTPPAPWLSPSNVYAGGAPQPDAGQTFAGPGQPHFSFNVTYQNEESWDIKRDANGSISNVIIHREAQESNPAGDVQQ